MFNLRNLTNLCPTNREALTRLLLLFSTHAVCTAFVLLHQTNTVVPPTPWCDGLPTNAEFSVICKVYQARFGARVMIHMVQQQTFEVAL